jgi:uncharacterized damage-inducible protein DinB
MKRSTAFLLGLALVAMPAAPAVAQDVATTTEAADPSLSAVREIWQQMTGYVTATAEQVPDSLYDWKPTPEVRSFGQMIGHVAGAQYMFCAAALGDSARAEDDIEKSRTTKAELLQALRESTEYCGRAYALTPAQLEETVNLFGMDRSKFFILALNATHNGEHYGNLVTYMRMNGMVPPSSQPRQQSAQ